MMLKQPQRKEPSSQAHLPLLKPAPGPVLPVPGPVPLVRPLPELSPPCFSMGPLPEEVSLREEVEPSVPAPAPIPDPAPAPVPVPVRVLPVVEPAPERSITEPMELAPEPVLVVEVVPEVEV